MSRSAVLHFSRIVSRIWPAFSLLILLSPGGIAVAQQVTVTNVFQDHYHYGFPIGDQNCPSGINIPSGQYPTTYHLERGHKIHHLDPKNSANDYWVFWAHFDSGNYSTAEAAVFKSTTECGPYMLQTGLYPQYNVDGAGYAFQPGGWQVRDDNIFRDNDQTYNPDGTVASYASAYFIAASDDLGTQTSSSGGTCSYANDSMAIFKMTPDYLGIDATTSPSTNGANWVFVCDQREAPVMFGTGSKYFLVTSQAAGWYPSQGGYGVSSNPLTGWTADPLALGNTSTFGLQTADGFTIQGTQANTYVLSFDHLGGADSKNPASSEKYDTGNLLLPLALDDTTGTATLNWYSSWTVDNTTGVLTLPTVTNLASSGIASSTVTSAANSGSTTYVPANAFDENYSTKWQDTLSGSSAFSPTTSTTSTLCPVTNATPSTTCNPSLITDLGSVQAVQEIQLSWYMVHGSEPYYTFKIAYSSDNINWNTLDYTAWANASNATTHNISLQPFSNNILYGFNAVPVNFQARYVALLETSVVQQNSTSPFYAPNLYEMKVIQSTAPNSPQSVTVTATPSASSVSSSNSFTVAVNVGGPTGQPVPTGYIQLSAPGYVSETYGLVNGANSFTVPAGALAGGSNTLTVAYRSDPTSVPVYGIETTTGTAGVTITAPTPPTNLTVTASSPAALTANWTAVVSATGYTVYRSTDGGTTFTQLGTTTSTSYTDSGLTDGSTYCYEVASSNAAGTGSPSGMVCGVPTSSFAPANVQVTQWASGQLYVSWLLNGAANSYVVKRSVNGGAYSTVSSPTALTYTDTGLTNYTNVYCYIVDQVYNGVTGPDSPAVCNTPTADYVTVADSSFESPVVSLWSTQPSFTNGHGWTFVGNGTNAGNNSGISALSGTFTNANTPPIPLGNQVGLLEGTGTVTQTINLTAGQKYTLVVTASQRQTSYQSGGANPFKATLNGTTLGTFTPPQSIPYYRDYSVTFTASQASNTLVLAGTSASTTSAVLIDNVRIVATGNTSFAITAQPATVASGASTVTLTATANLGSTTAPSSPLIFQVNGGSQQPGSCTLSGSTYTCTVSYSLPALSAGGYPVNVVYLGDANYVTASGSSTLTVNP